MYNPTRYFKKTNESKFCQNLDCENRGKEILELVDFELKREGKIKIELIKVCKSCKKKLSL